MKVAIEAGRVRTIELRRGSQPAAATTVPTTDIEKPTATAVKVTKETAEHDEGIHVVKGDIKEGKKEPTATATKLTKEINLWSFETKECPRKSVLNHRTVSSAEPAKQLCSSAEAAR